MDVGNYIKIDAHERAVAELHAKLAVAEQREAEIKAERDRWWTAATERAETINKMATTIAQWDAQCQELQAKLAAAEARYQEEYAIVDRLWTQLGVPEYAGKSIYEYVGELQARARELEQRLEAYACQVVVKEADFDAVAKDAVEMAKLVQRQEEETVKREIPGWEWQNKDYIPSKLRERPRYQAAQRVIERYGGAHE